MDYFSSGYRIYWYIGLFNNYYYITCNSKTKFNEITENISTSEITCEEIIGKGSFGDVWRASWRGQQIAVKLIPLEKVQKGSIIQMTKEVQLMRSLRHPCVLQFFGSGMDKNFLLIAMELMTNGTVHDLLNNESLIISWVNKLRMLKDAASGMFYLHHCRPPVIHRDLKSFNLLVDDDWCVKVSDFGLSIPLQGESINSTNLCGTMAWIAPECFQNKPFGIKIDVYSYGVVMWEFLTREEPFADMAPFVIMTQVSEKHMRPPIPPDSDSDPEYIQLMKQCWDDNPDNRPTFDEVINRLTLMIEKVETLPPTII
ncbi:Tyrosine protein kinase transforming protein SEA [Entamoeba marina]